MPTTQQNVLEWEATADIEDEVERDKARDRLRRYHARKGTGRVTNALVRFRKASPEQRRLSLKALDVKITFLRGAYDLLSEAETWEPLPPQPEET